MRYNMHCLDHLGNKFKTISDMCKHYNISRSIYDHRIRAGWSKQDALTTPPKRRIQDNNGNVFDSFADLCKFHNIDYGRSISRLKRNQNINTVIDPNIYSQNNKIIDPYGIEHDSKNAFCRYYHIKKSTLNKKLRDGWTLPEILKITPRINRQSKHIKCLTNYIVIRHVKDDYYLCNVNNHHVILKHDVIINNILFALKQGDKL